MDEHSFTVLTYGPISISREFSEEAEQLTISGIGDTRRVILRSPLQDSMNSTWRIVVDGRRVQYFQGDKRLFTGTLPENSFPWLRLTASGTPLIKSFRLRGQPNVPSSIPLISGTALSGWKPAPDREHSYYRGSTREIARPLQKRFHVRDSAPCCHLATF